MPKRCIISWAVNGREQYTQGLHRLIPSAIDKGGHDGDFIIVSPGFPQDKIRHVEIVRDSKYYIPTHASVPYGFKPYLFKHAFEAGADQVLWCDSTIVIHKDLGPVWDVAEKRGAALYRNAGCMQATFTADDCLAKMNCTIEHARKWEQVMACAMAIDFRHAAGKAMFERWYTLCNDGVSFAGRSGSSRPDFNAHRHDQSCVSYLAQCHNIDYVDVGTLVYHNDLGKFQDAIMANTGIGQV